MYAAHIRVFVDDDEFQVGVNVDFFENHGFDFEIDEFSQNEGTWESGDDVSDELSNAVYNELSDNEYDYRVTARSHAAELARDAHFGL